MKVIVGKEEFILDPGDSLYFNSMIPHKMLAITETAKFITIILL